MRYKVEWVEVKAPDWKIASLTSIDGTFKETGVSINRTNKKGEVFPNFDGITPGAEIDGNPWKSSAGKWYLFAPEVITQKTFAAKPSGIKAMQERKSEMIEKSQDRKEESIAKSGAQRDAVLIVTTFYKDQILTPTEIAEKVEYWYKHFLVRSEQPL